MRIRKNPKLASMILTTAGYGGERHETYVCHLNQSPWDVVPVTSSCDSSWFLPSPPLIHQFDGEDSFNGNVSVGDSNVAAERNNRSLVFTERLNLIAVADYYERSPDVEDPMDPRDNSDNKSKATEPDSPVKNSGTTASKSLSSTAASSNPYEFYYHSGFGPRWGRKRGGSDDEKIVMGDIEKRSENNLSKKSGSNDEMDDKTASYGDGSSRFLEEDYDVFDQDNDNGKMKKKRGRKRVKERSLKSLM